MNLWASEKQKGWLTCGDWHLGPVFPSFLCSSLLLISIPPSRLYLTSSPVKVFLSPSACPCHGRQRHPGLFLSLSSFLSLFIPLSFFCLCLSSFLSPVFSLCLSLFLPVFSISFFLCHSISIISLSLPRSLSPSLPASHFPSPPLSLSVSVFLLDRKSVV